MTNEGEVKEKESAILKVAQLYSLMKNVNAIGLLIKNTRPFLNCLSKAKAAKLVRDLLGEHEFLSHLICLDMAVDIGMEYRPCEFRPVILTVTINNYLLPRVLRGDCKWWGSLTH